jgi:endonuclease/exonuclease/phosphatase family metal-dependent hydrolase
MKKYSNKTLRLLSIAILLLFTSFCALWTSKNSNSPNHWKVSLGNFQNNLALKKIFSILTYNIGYASGMANNLPAKMNPAFFMENLESIVNTIQQSKADIIAAQEVDLDSQRSFQMNQARIIGRKTGFPFIAITTTWDKSFIPYPFWPIAPLGKMLSGQVVISKFPILSEKIYDLKQITGLNFLYDFFFKLFGGKRVIQEVIVSLDRTPVHILNVHLESLSKEAREDQAYELLKIYNRIRNKPVIILGDFNSVPPYEKKLKDFPNDPDNDNYEDDKSMQLIYSEKSLKPAISKEKYLKNSKDFFTFSSGTPSRTIDHIFYNDKIEYVDSKVLSGAGKGSDHFPVLFRFKVRSKTI